MKRDEKSWFGFKISQKQSVHIFIGSIIGLFFTIFLLIALITSFLTGLTYWEPYYDISYENYALQQTMILLPLLLTFIAFSAFWLFSMVRCIEISKHYSNRIDSISTKEPILRYEDIKSNSFAQFCPICGTAQKALEKFCINCGHKID